MEEVIVRLKEKAKSIPTKPGVYMMRDSSGEIIYIGKAINLRNRVRNYLGVGDGRMQLPYLVRRMNDIEIFMTTSEEEAFVLERDLIQRYKPRYNIRLKDDKSFYHVRIDRNEPWPRIELTRKVQSDGALYFGPFSFSTNLKSLLEVIRQVVPLRSCSNTVFFNRVRPCLEYQIKRCLGPCCLKVNPEEYQEHLEEAISLLRGNIEKTTQTLTVKMEHASNELRFEEAARIRDRLIQLEKYVENTPASEHTGGGRDVIAVHQEDLKAIAVIILTRGGRIIDTKSFSFDEVNFSQEELLESVISQFYIEAGRDIPDEIVISQTFENLPIIEKGLTKRKGSDVRVFIPEEGSALRLMGIAELNAKQGFSAQFEGEKIHSEIASELARRFSLRQVPRRIETIDISNFQGTDVVGALVCFIDGYKAKEHYRKYNISFDGTQNDFQAIYEVVLRRLTHAEEDLPDLLLIDGGKAQLEMACKAAFDAKVEIDIVSIAKARTESNFASKDVISSYERVFTKGSDEAIALIAHDPVTLFLTRMRDEVHRFVITFHRSKRSKRAVSSELDSIRGVRPDSRARLLRAFGTIDDIKKKTSDEIAKAGRIPKSLAEKILKHLRAE